MQLTSNARLAYATFYPWADEDDLQWVLTRGVPCPESIALVLAGRTGRHARQHGDYLLHHERTGLFVLDEDRVVTFITFFSQKQHELARRLFSGGATPTAQARWNSFSSTNDVLPGLPAKMADVIVTKSLLFSVFGQLSENEVKAASWKLRHFVRCRMERNQGETVTSSNLYIGTVPGFEQVRTKAEVSVYLHNPNGSPHWWLTSEIRSVNAEHERMAKILRDAGWCVKGPVE